MTNGGGSAGLTVCDLGGMEEGCVKWYEASFTSTGLDAA